jgi:hypothetical protein
VIMQIEDHIANRARVEREAIDHIVARLTLRFSHIDSEHIRQAVHREFEVYAEARVRDFIPILVERAVREHLGSTRMRDSA